MTFLSQKLKLLLVLSFVYLSVFGGNVGQAREPIIQLIGQEPYSYITDDGRVEGYFYEIANRMLEKAGYSIKSESVPVKRLARNLNSGMADCSFFPAIPTIVQMFSAVTEIGHLLEIGVLPKVGIQLDAYNDLRDIEVGVPIGFTMGSRFDNDPLVHRKDVPDYYHGTRMLWGNRIEAVGGAIESIRFTAHKALGEGHALFDTPYILMSGEITLFCRKTLKDTEILSRLKKAMIDMRESGETQAIIKAYFDRHLFVPQP